MPCRFPIVPLLLAAAAPCSAQVTVIGVGDALRENVIEYLPDPPPCDAPADEITSFADDLPTRIRPSLDAFGFYSAEIAAERVEQEGCWQIRLTIAPGNPVVVRTAAVELRGDAEADAAMTALFEQFPLAEGDPLHHGLYQAFKDAVEVLARQRGYFEGGFAEQRIDVYVDDARADIALLFDSGSRHRFGEIEFDTDALNEDVLRSFPGFAEGDPYDAALVGDLQRDLISSGYFISANVTADINGAADGLVPVRIEAEADRATSYTAGGGYSTDDGPRLRFSYDNERFNRAGHQLRAQAMLSQVHQTAGFDYRTPVGNPQRDWRSYRFGLAREDFVAGVSLGLRLGVRRTRVGEHLTTTRFFDALLERDEIGTADFSGRMLIPGISWLRSYRDDLARPREGHRLSLVLTAGLGSQVSLVRADFRGKWITAMPWDARLILRGRAGALADDGEFGFVPLSMRFFAGGDNSVRGFDYQSLGPRNQFDNLIGGNRLLEASVEYEHPLLDDWSAAVFVDSGNAFLDSGFETRTGAGIGARWFSPLGPVRLDVAWPLDGPNRSPRLHLSLGPDL